MQTSSEKKESSADRAKRLASSWVLGASQTTWMDESTEMKWHSASTTTSRGRLQATQPSPPYARFCPASWASLSYLHGDLLGPARSDRTHDLRSRIALFVRCSSTVSPSCSHISVISGKLYKYIGTFFSWDREQSRGVKMADQLRTAFATGAGPAKRIHPFAL